MNTLQTPQNEGFKAFFTKHDKPIIAMQYARQNAKYNRNQSSLYADNLIKNSHFSGALHFANTDYELDEDKRYFDLDLSSAYITWTLNYKRGNFDYYVGGSKEYFQRYDYFKFNRHENEGLNTYRIKFAVKTDGLQNSKIYRKWIVKTMKVNSLIMSNKEIAGTISIPNIKNMVNRFLEDVQGYEEHVVEIAGIVRSTGLNSVFINEDNIVKAMRIKNSSHEDSDLAKLMLNSSTGYLAIADKILYYTMVNHVKAVVFDLIEYIERWNIRRPDDTIDIVAANTDGITIYADKRLELILESILEHEFNDKSPFKFRIKNIYTLDEAHFTPNDVRMKKVS